MKRRDLTPLFRTLLAAGVLLAAGAAPASAGGPAASASSGSLRCFGAADRDPERPCENRRLRLRVTPTPEEALLEPNLVCTKQAADGDIVPCAVGAPANRAVETVAMIGDSHAGHWRAALHEMGTRLQWRILEVAIPHCPFSTAQPDSGPEFDFCPEWNRQVTLWLRKHPEIRIVLVSANAGAPIKARPGLSTFQTRVQGHVEAWKAVAPSVQRLVVIRDSPINRFDTFECITTAMKRRRPAGRACRIPRRRALPADAEIAAAKLLPARTRIVDLTPHFCDRRYCYPVVGGVLVHQDIDHIGPLFGRTLGPFLTRAVVRALTSR